SSNFGLPDLQGLAPLHAGQGPGLSQYFLGEVTGSENVTLLSTEIPAHSHSFSVSSASAATVTDGTNNQLGQGLTGNKQNSFTAKIYSPNAGSATQMSPASGGVSGSSFPHNNMMPYLTLNFCIAIQGIFPARP